MSRGRARVVQFFALLCFMAAGAGATTIPAMLIAPQWMAFTLDCDHSCRPTPTPIDTLSPETQRIIAHLPGADARMLAAFTERDVWWKAFGIQILDALPFVFLFLSVGMALWRFGGCEERRDRIAVRWLQRATAAGVVLVITSPVCTALRDTLFLGLLTDMEEFSYNIEFTEVANNLLLAGAAWASTWALAAGQRARGELAEIV